jgi:hypothetical protein
MVNEIIAKRIAEIGKTKACWELPGWRRESFRSLWLKDPHFVGEGLGLVDWLPRVKK